MPYNLPYSLIAPVTLRSNQRGSRRWPCAPALLAQPGDAQRVIPVHRGDPGAHDIGGFGRSVCRSWMPAPAGDGAEFGRGRAGHKAVTLTPWTLASSWSASEKLSTKALWRNRPPFRPRLEGGGRGDVEDLARFGSDHRRQDGVGKLGQRAAIEVDHRPLRGPSSAAKRPASPKPALLTRQATSSPCPRGRPSAAPPRRVRQGRSPRRGHCPARRQARRGGPCAARRAPIAPRARRAGGRNRPPARPTRR